MMKLSEDIASRIENEYNEWCSIQYGSGDEKHRKDLGQFYTPPSLTVKMLEKFDDLDGNFLDPTCGAGGLIAAAVIAGANPRKCFGIELDSDIVKIARKRLSKLGVPPFNIKCGNALEPNSYEFDENHLSDNLVEIDIKDLGLSSFEIDMSVSTPVKVVNKIFVLNLLDDEKTVKIVEKLHKIFQKLNSDYWYVGNEKLDLFLKIFKSLFKKYLSIDYEFSNRKIIVK